MKHKILSVLGVLMAVILSTAALSACSKAPAGADSSGEPLLPSPWGRWRGAVPWHCTVTDEGSPLTAGLTSARTLANSVHGAAAPSAPSEGFGFRAPPVADAARKASRCRPRTRDSEAEA